MESLCEDLKTDTNVPANLINDVENDIKEVQDTVNEVYDSADGINWHTKSSSVPAVWGFVAAVCVFSLILFLCTSVEFYEGKIGGCKKTCWKFSTFTFLFFLWLFILAQFTTSMIIGDACQNKTDTIHQAIDRAEQPWDIAEYYVICNGTIPFPWEDDFNTAYTTLEEIEQDIALGQAAAVAKDDTALLHTLNEMSALTNSSVDHLDRTKENLQCTVFHDDFDHVTDTACTKFLNLWFCVYFFQTFMIIFLSCAKCGNSCMYATSPKDGGHWYGRLTGDDNYHYTRGSINGSVTEYGSRSFHKGTNATTRKCCERLLKYEGVERELQVQALREQGYAEDNIQKALAILRREENLGHDTNLIDFSVYNL